VAAAAAIAATLVLLLAVVLVVAGWLADSRRARVPDSAVEDISAAMRVVADVQERNPTDSHYERYVVVASGGSTRQEQRRSVTEALRATGWEFSTDAPSIGGRDGVGLLLTDTTDVRADDAGLAARLDDRIPPNDRGRPLVVLVLLP